MLLIIIFVVKVEDKSSSYLTFGDKKNNAILENTRSVSNKSENKEGVVKVKEINGVRPLSRPSSVPHLPSIQNNRTTSGGLRKLQDHLAKVQNGNSDLEALDEEEIESITTANS